GRFRVALFRASSPRPCRCRAYRPTATSGRRRRWHMRSDRAAFGNAGGDDVLGEIARGIGGRAVDLGRVLAGEGAAAGRGVAAIGVDDDFAASEAAVPVGAADYEIAGRIDQEIT